MDFRDATLTTRALIPSHSLIPGGNHDTNFLPHITLLYLPDLYILSILQPSCPAWKIMVKKASNIPIWRNSELVVWVPRWMEHSVPNPTPRRVSVSWNLREAKIPKITKLNHISTYNFRTKRTDDHLEDLQQELKIIK